MTNLRPHGPSSPSTHAPFHPAGLALSRRHRQAAILLVAAVFALVLGCRHLDTPHPVLARTHRFSVTAEDLARWTPVLGRDRKLRRASRQSDPTTAMLRQIALVRIVVQDGEHLLSDHRRAVIEQDLADREVRRVYDREVLVARVAVSRDEARLIFEEHRDGYRKAPGVRSLEIFCWAPADLPELREQKRRLLEGLRLSVDSPKSFEEAAWSHSDATSAVWSGHIGTMLENQIGEPLRSALFDAEPGVTQVIESAEGLFLFWVVGFTPAKDNRFEDVADGIFKRLQRQRIEVLRNDAVTKVLGGLELTDPPLVNRSAAVARYQGQELTLIDLSLDTPEADRIRARIVARAMREQLATLDVAIPDPPSEEVDWRLFREIWPAMVEQWQSGRQDTPDPGPGQAEIPQAEIPQPEVRQVERWSFDLLVIDGCRTQRELFQTFRSLHELGSDSDLEALAGHLRETWNLQPTVRSYDQVSSPDAAALGPEIHTTLKRRLGVLRSPTPESPAATTTSSRLSKPMHIADRDQVVVVELRGREVDHAATVSTAQGAAARRTALKAAKDLENHLLAINGFTELQDRRGDG